MAGVGSDAINFLGDDVDIVCRLDSLDVLRMNAILVLHEQIIVGHKGLLLHLLLLDDQDADLLAVLSCSCEEVHIVAADDCITQKIIFDLLALQMHTIIIR